jgi:hypothetical protein
MMPPRVLGRVTLQDSERAKKRLLDGNTRPGKQDKNPAVEELTRQSLSEAFGKPSLAGPEDAEEKRVHGELLKLDQAGAFKEPDDKAFFASVIRTLGGTCLPKREQSPAPIAGGTPWSRWSAKVLTGYLQPRTREENRAFLMVAFNSEDVFDFSNPGDVEEYKRLHQPIDRTHTKRPSREGLPRIWLSA